jgi:dTDP-4-amino-4,6-dideoxygalactose transaminase
VTLAQLEIVDENVAQRDRMIRLMTRLLAEIPGITPLPIPDYPQNEKTRWEHLERIREHLGFVKCDEAARQHLGLRDKTSLGLYSGQV